MDPIKDGGPAFPYSALEPDNVGGGLSSTMYADNKGMTLRDYFAAKVMQAIYMRLGGSPADTDTNSVLYTAEASYKQADAMLRAREN